MLSYTAGRNGDGMGKRAEKIKVVAAGNGGINILDRIAVEIGGGVDCIAVNTEQNSLATSVATRKILCGGSAARAGAGGDPRIGQAAVAESAEELESIFDGTDALILLGALGGGTSGRVLAHLARRAAARGIASFAVVTLPLSFEGKSRSELASADLEEIRGLAGMSVVFPNDGMAELADPEAPLSESFFACDVLLASVVLSLIGIFHGSGPMDVSAGEVLSALAAPKKQTFFSHSVAKGGNRANDVVAGVFRSPLARAGLAPGEVKRLLVHVSAGPEISFSEVQAIFAQVRAQTQGEVAFYLGISIGRGNREEIGLTLIGSDLGLPQAAVVSKAGDSEGVVGIESGRSLGVAGEKGEEEKGEKGEGMLPGMDLPEESIVAPLPRVQKKEKPVKFQQTMLPLVVEDRGHFTKTSPTMEDGEDLDVPTFSRKKINLNA